MVVVADNVPVIVTLPGIVTAPLESIVRRATPPVTKDNSSFAGLINPVFVSPSNFKAQLFRSPDFENNELDKFTNKMLEKVTNNLENFNYNVIVANMYETYNYLIKKDLSIGIYNIKKEKCLKKFP